MLPADSSIEWNVCFRAPMDNIVAQELIIPQHFPNTTVVAAESATERTFHVFGVMQTVTTADGECSTT